MVTDAHTAKEIAEIREKNGALANDDTSVIVEPKKRGGRTKKSAE